MKHTFASDNYSGVHPQIMQALTIANHGHASAYGADDLTAKAVNTFKKIFGSSIEVFFVYNGTGANVLGLSILTRPYNSIICSELAHINVDESTAPETFTGCKLITIQTSNGKITPAQIEEKIQRVGDQHHPQAKVISISQPTEYGTVYTTDEVIAISQVAKRHGLYLHMDGSRICNAAVCLNQEFTSFTADAGVDVLSFGGTKNGMMFGEAVILFNAAEAQHFSYVRKQSMQLHSKMRFISAQFLALLNNDCWKKIATHSNKMARRLALGLQEISEVRITQSVEANGVFVTMPKKVASALQQEYFFYLWNEKTSEARLMCSFDTTEKDVDGLIEKLKELLKRES